MEGSRCKAKPINTYLAIAGFCLLLGGCGDNGFVFIAVNTGFVLSTGACNGAFNMRNDGGLSLVVIIGSGTSILLANGTIGTCADILPGARASVRGPTRNGRVNASQVQLQ